MLLQILKLTGMNKFISNVSNIFQKRLIHNSKSIQHLETRNFSSKEPISRLNLKYVQIEEFMHSYSPKDGILYALGVGMSTQHPNSLNFLYENSNDFQILPTFPVITGVSSILKVLLEVPQLNIQPAKIVHGEEYLEIFRSLNPLGATIKLKPKIVDVLDKITGTLYIFQVDGEDERGPLFKLESAIFEMGSGKFGGSRSTNASITKPLVPPQRQPDQTFEYATTVDQAALYRLNGDFNPLHIDPAFARIAGFNCPILHGLCSLGIAGRIILQNYAQGNSEYFQAIKVRFSKPVFPGDTLQINTWIEDLRIYFEAKIKESQEVALSGGYVDLLKIQ